MFLHLVHEIWPCQWQSWQTCLYTAGDDGHSTWKGVSSVDAADQQRWHSVLDSCMWQALQAMIDELSKAWESGLSSA